jgi:hypothetical protein
MQAAPAPAGVNSTWRATAVAAAFLILLGATRGTSLGDTSSYAREIADHLGMSLFGGGNSLWEAGHLIWRPLGWVLLSAASPVLSGLTDWTPFMQAGFTLITISALSSIVTVILWYLLLIDLVGTVKTAFLLTLALACSHGFLLYAHSGCPYIPGLTCVTASLYLLRRRNMTAAAIFYALASLLWLPYILSGLALVLVAAGPADWSRRIRDSVPDYKSAVRFSLISAVIIVAVYFVGASARGITTFGEATAWVFGANHDLSQNLKAVRIVGGLPRSFFYMGKDALILKRFMRHDPYAPVAAADLLVSGLWKIGAFYLFAACLLHALWRRAWSGWPLLVLLAGTAPVVLFAVLLFEPSMPERYLPALPFLVLAIGWIFGDFPGRRQTSQFMTRQLMTNELIIAGFFLAAALNNLYAFAAPRVANKDEASWRRVAELRSSMRGASVAVVTSNQDELQEYLNRSIFGKVNRPEVFRLYDAIEPGSLRMLQWREEFAREVLSVWKDGGAVWISRRVWSTRPRPDWNWVEGDDSREIWSDLRGFFSVLQTDIALDGSDGFARLARNDANMGYLMPLAAAYKPLAAATR